MFDVDVHVPVEKQLLCWLYITLKISNLEDRRDGSQ